MIRVYNTMSRRKEDLVPLEEGRIKMYVCGPTVYNYIHIGNARTFINFDVIRRYLLYRGYEVLFVQNITDVDDKIIAKAKEEGVAPNVLADAYRDAFELDMADLGVMPPDVAPRATEHIGDMVDVIACLVEKGYAYVSDGDVYFEVEKFADYGRLSGRRLDEQRHGEVACSTDLDERKRGPWDFALWKAAKPGEPSWESPWGPGRPGWHIECSTMSGKYLGDGFDIHGGGLDLVFPHHENEIAQAEACTGNRFVRYWLHSGMLNVDMEKMSKSLGNITSCREVLARHDAQTVRMLMLGTHYRGPLNFSDDSLSDARAQLERINNCRFNLADAMDRAPAEPDGGGPPDIGPAGSGPRAAESEAGRALSESLGASLEEFRSRMDDDFNTASALGALFDAVREINGHLARVTAGSVPADRRMLAECDSTLTEMLEAVGLFQTAYGFTDRPGPLPEQATLPVTDGPARDELIELLLRVRQDARGQKAFELADRIRDGLADMGVRVEDIPDGYRWRIEG